MSVAHRASVAIIGGLTAAVSLLQAEFDVQVFEQAPVLGEVGAGINIGPNASRILHRLGITEMLGRTGVKPITFDQRRWDDGRVLLRSPLGEEVEAAFGAPYYIHRSDLHRAFGSTRVLLEQTVEFEMSQACEIGSIADFGQGETLTDEPRPLTKHDFEIFKQFEVAFESRREVWRVEAEL